MGQHTLYLGIFIDDMSGKRYCTLGERAENICYAVGDPADTCQQNNTMVHCKYSAYEVTAEIHE